MVEVSATAAASVGVTVSIPSCCLGWVISATRRGRSGGSCRAAVSRRAPFQRPVRIATRSADQCQEVSTWTSEMETLSVAGRLPTGLPGTLDRIVMMILVLCVGAMAIDCNDRLFWSVSSCCW